MFRPITLKQLNILTRLDTRSCLGNLGVTQKTSVQEVSGSIPGSDKDCCVCLLVLLPLCYFWFCQKIISCHKSLLYAVFLIQYTEHTANCVRYYESIKTQT